jgi:hypothetical protein
MRSPVETDLEALLAGRDITVEMWLEHLNNILPHKALIRSEQHLGPKDTARSRCQQSMAEAPYKARSFLNGARQRSTVSKGARRHE